MEAVYHDILIIGAGMAGLACARHLAEAGLTPALIDKGRGPGGRMAARRVTIAGKDVSFDHGAQYFTARDPAFRAAVAAWESAGAAARWPEAGEEAFVGTPGMNGPLKAMASELAVRWGVRALSLVRQGEVWRVATDAGEITARTVLVAVPAEQASELLSEAAPDLAAIPASVVSAPCWAVLAAFDRAVPLTSAVMRGEGAVSWAARNASKPQRAGAETWVIHASPERSRALLDLPKDEVAATLLEDFRLASGLASLPPTLHCDAHRWLYALPQVAAGAPARFDPALRLGIAGDYLHSPRVEGAWLSGRALAQAVSGTSASTA
ncbi:MAG: NAD(P)/FAD-dependent oxidoreductase [Erythrobacter sp.]